MLSGLNASWIFFGGSILAYGIVAPSLVKNGLPFGKPGYPSPRYWLLWPSALIMLLYFFANIL
ncbi:hypothetical protein K435DRAFT_783268 [Dendrothele bispora CBS 962.96]|uniref:Uncharacterized protein n=1 Tax=Dendrothele bispora (strain CBS 962.96) TaxID=1314807 RepID=A0A4S8LA96_DENBC|nr:hypothetical protein K435DRAFT_783268 [Dendrothele bispora CBS 962.96]